MATLVVLILAKGIVVLGIIILLQAGQVSFGHAMFFAAGSYTAGFWGKYLGVGDLMAYLVVGTVVATILGLLVGLFVVRYREIFFGMLNLAFSMVLWSLLEKIVSSHQRGRWHAGAASDRVRHDVFTGEFPVRPALSDSGDRHRGHLRRAAFPGKSDRQHAARDQIQRDAAGISRRLRAAASC